jgi:hypothetical protein
MIFGSWFDHIKYGASEILAHFADFFGAGVIDPTNDFELAFPATPNMTVNVGAGVARINGYRVHNDGSSPVTLTFTAADATFPRIDLVQVGPLSQLDVDPRLGTSQPLGRIFVKKGTPSVSPVQPTPDANMVALYAVSIAANQTTVTSANVTDLRALVPFYFTAMNTPMSAIGDMIYGGIAGAMVRLPGNTSTTKKFLSSTGTGSAAQQPTWSTIAATDLPTLDQIPAPAANVSINSHRLTNVADPVNPQDAATMHYVSGLTAQYSGIKYITSGVTLDGTYGKALTVLQGSVPYTVILPAAGSYSVGTALTFMSSATASVTLSRTGSDIIIVNSSAIYNTTLSNGDTLTLVSNGVNGWYATTGSQQLGYSGAFGSNLTTSGYQLLPSGLILQWSLLIVSSPSVNAVTTTSVTWPIAFPNSNLHVSAFASTDQPDAVQVSLGFNGTSGATVYLYTSLPFATIPVYFWAVGH